MQLAIGPYACGKGIRYEVNRCREFHILHLQSVLFRSISKEPQDLETVGLNQKYYNADSLGCRAWRPWLHRLSNTAFCCTADIHFGRWFAHLYPALYCLISRAQLLSVSKSVSGSSITTVNSCTGHNTDRCLWTYQILCVDERGHFLYSWKVAFVPPAL